MNPLLVLGETATAVTIDWSAVTSVVTVDSVVALIQSAFPLIAVAVMCSIVASVILWAIGMLRNIF